MKAGRRQRSGQGQAKGKGKGKDGKEPGKGNEENTAKGEGNRKADGTVSNKESSSNDANGDGSFMHLPPRQRELIRQAISGNLPPEYAEPDSAVLHQHRPRPPRLASSPPPAPASQK